MNKFSIVVLGLSITSSWGNGHAVTYRGLIRELSKRGHEVLFLERDVPWYADNRDLPDPPYCRTELYKGVADLKVRFSREIRNADAVIVGSYVPDGVKIGRWINDLARGVTAFYDIDTPVTLAKLLRGDYEYVSPDLIPTYKLYLSFTGGPVLQRIESEFGSPAARALYCSVDPESYYEIDTSHSWDLGYLGTYSDDRQPALNSLLISPANDWTDGRFIVAGPQYPASIMWPSNVQRIDHLPPSEHHMFYNSQRLTLNVTRSDMIQAGWSPSVRLFEAAACATPIISDWWQGLSDFFTPGEEILIAKSKSDVLRYLRTMSDDELHKVGRAAQSKCLKYHCASNRAEELEHHILECKKGFPRGRSTHSGRRNAYNELGHVAGHRFS